MAAEAWTDLLDPGQDELGRHLPSGVLDDDVDHLLRPAEQEPRVRPTLRGRGDYVFGLLLLAVAVPEEDRVFYQEIDVVLARDRIVTVRKTPPGEQPFDPERIREICDSRDEKLSPGMVAYHLFDEIAEGYLKLLDDLDEEIDELEEHVDSWPYAKTRRRLTGLRHDLLHIRRTVAPTRDAVRGVSDGQVDIEKRVMFRREEVFPREVEQRFASVYDKLLRATEAIELSRDLLAAVRDYHQAKIANDQNEVVKRLTAIASILLVPTFIVGVYGQNFRQIPELRWGFGYWWSWGWIVVTTVLQVVYFRRKRWI